MASNRARAVLAASLMLSLVPFGLVAPIAAGAAFPASYQDAISMQAQQKAQWCWAGSGNTIATFDGVAVSQARFCQLAHNENGADCADLPGTLPDLQRAFAGLGFTSAGTAVGGRIPYAAIQAQTASDHPIETRIGWRAGGGHMHVVYGYDTNGGWVYWGDPWPSYRRYNWSTYDYYTQNKTFTWTNTLTGIAR